MRAFRPGGVQIDNTETPDRIIIDYLRNDFVTAAVMEDCGRARASVPVAVQLDCTELA